MARIGLTGCDIGISHHLTRAVGQSIASELMLTGRFINAERALRTGLVSELVADEDLEATGRELAQEMLRLTPISLYLTKEGVNFAIDSGSLEATIAMENRQQVLAANGPDFAEGIAAFLEKRPPKFGA
jgi:enoyl-CoA hydratase/carnithine racemase